MKKPLRPLIAVLCMSLAGAASAQSAADYPARTVRLIVPSVAGAATDVLTRLAAPFMERRFKQSFIVENRPGGFTLIGVDAVMKSPPDGYTLLVSAGNMAVEQGTNKDWPVRVERDLTPIALFAGGGFALIVPTSLPVKSLRDLVAYAKANPGKLNEAAASSLSPDIQVLKHRLGMPPLEPIIYKGGTPAVQAVVTGEAHFFGAAVLDVVQLEKADKLRIIGYTERERHPLIPHVPTVREAGVGISDFEAGYYFVMMGPAGLPAEIVNKMNAAMIDLVRAPEFLDKANAFGMRTYASSPAETRARLLADIKQYQELAAQGVKLR